MADALFDLEAAAAPEPDRRLGPDARRTIRRAQAMAHGSHPLVLLGGHLRLHADAPPADDRAAPGPRCGNCALAVVNAFDYLKCTVGRSGEIGTPSFRRGPYETHGTASDLRYWWPGCERWQARRG